MKRKTGFTLIELLVVIAIIAILAAILFPVFLNAQKNARLSACVNNMKQMGVAINLYLSDYNGAMPQATNIWDFSVVEPPAPPAWNDYFSHLRGYLKGFGYAICPCKYTSWMDSRMLRLWYYGGDRSRPSPWRGATYTPSAYNWRKADPALLNHGLLPKYLPGFRPEMRWSQRGSLTRPDSIDYAATFGTTRRSEVVILFCMSGTWTSFSGIQGIPADRIIRGPHDKGTPVLFCDMHAGVAGPVEVGFL